MLRKLFIAIAIFVCTILQCCVFPSFHLISITPNLLIALTVSYGLMKGRKSGLFTGLFCGLVQDILFGRVLGFYTLLYLVIGYLNGCFNKLFYPEDIKLPLAATAISDLVYNLAIYFFLFLFRGRFQIGYYTLHIIMPEMVYTTLITLVLFPIVLKINQHIEKREKRSAIKFG